MNRTITLLLALPMVLASIASAQAYSYSQNFNSLPSSGAATAISGTGPLASQGALTAISAAGTSWQAARIAGTLTTPVNLMVDSGASNSGAIFSYGATSSGNRSLGSLASGSTVPAFGAAITNTSGAILHVVTINFESQQWRSSSNSSATVLGVVNTLQFAYGLSTSGITSSNFLSSALMTNDPFGDVIGGSPSGTTTANVGLVQLGPTYMTLSGINWNPGDTFYFRWQDTNDVANDAGLAIDDLVFSGYICRSDLNGDGYVDGADMGLLLLAFGNCPGCPEDLDGDAVVDAADVGLMLLDFGPCP
ncbi:MAG: hypothetical protein K8R92_06715 [Planctomycetes bacterium]|nr:hypothetical protein [Planctomycetota bacterium]